MPNPPAPLIGKSLLGGVSTLRGNASTVAGVWALGCVLPGVLIFIACSVLGVSSDTFAAGIQTRDPRFFAALGLIASIWLGFRTLAFAMVIITVRSARRRPVVFRTVVVDSTSRFLALIAAMILSLLSFGVGLLLLILPGYYLIVRLRFVECAVCADGLSPTAAFRRSWSRTRGYFWPTAGLVSSVSLIMYVSLKIAGAFNAFAATTIGAHGTLCGATAGLIMNMLLLLIAAWATASMSRFFADLSSDKSTN